MRQGPRARRRIRRRARRVARTLFLFVGFALMAGGSRASGGASRLRFGVVERTADRAADGPRAQVHTKRLPEQFRITAT